jgi:hypothetical protein
VSIVLIGLPAVDGAETLRSVTAMIDREVEPFESHFEKVTVDDKGAFVLYAFGAPLSHENDPERAISAAVAVHDRLRAAGIEHSVGVWRRTQSVTTTSGPLGGTQSTSTLETYVIPQLTSIVFFPLTKPKQRFEPYLVVM